jgi:sugar phosphate isomerase/epimerase
MYSLGFVSAILPEYSLDQVLSFAAENQFDCVEVMCWPGDSADKRRYAGVCHLDVDDPSLAHAQNLEKAHGVSISGLGYYPNPLDPDKEKSEFYIEHIKKIIRAANRLNIPVVNTFIGRNPGLNMQENLALFEKLWAPIIAVAEQEQVKIGIENCPMLYTLDEWPGGKNLAVSPAVWDHMFRVFPTPLFGLNYDPSHPVLQRMDEIKPLYQYRERLHHVHLKDIKIYQDKLDRVGMFALPSAYHSPKLPGFGDVRWNEFFSALGDIRYRGPLVIEVEDKAYEGSPEDVVAGIRTARNYVKQFLP